MKYRNGFVTNSSSSNYIIAYKKDSISVDEETKKKYPWVGILAEGLIDMIISADGAYETEEADVLTDREDLEHYIRERYGEWRSGRYGSGSRESIESILDRLGKDDPEQRKLCDMMLAKIEEGYHIMDKDVGYSDETLTGVIEAIADGENIIMLYQCEA